MGSDCVRSSIGSDCEASASLCPCQKSALVGCLSGDPGGFEVLYVVCDTSLLLSNVQFRVKVRRLLGSEPVSFTVMVSAGRPCAP